MELSYPICGTIASTFACMSTNGSNTSTKSKEWGKWLERRIELSELTRQQFADRAGVAKSTVSRWINGDRPSAKQVDGIADALFLDPSDVMKAAGYLDGAISVDTGSPTARLMPLIEKVDWSSYPGRLESLENELRFMIENGQTRKGV